MVSKTGVGCAVMCNFSYSRYQSSCLDGKEVFPFSMTSLLGEFCFCSHSFCNLYPGAAPFLFPLFPPVQKTTDRIGNRIFVFLG